MFRRITSTKKISPKEWQHNHFIFPVWPIMQVYKNKCIKTIFICTNNICRITNRAECIYSPLFYISKKFVCLWFWLYSDHWICFLAIPCGNGKVNIFSQETMSAGTQWHYICTCFDTLTSIFWVSTKIFPYISIIFSGLHCTLKKKTDYQVCEGAIF